MNNLQLNAISRTAFLLDQIDSYKVYNAVSEELKELEIEDDKSMKILKTLNTSMSKNVSNNIKESKLWLSALNG